MARALEKLGIVGRSFKNANISGLRNKSRQTSAFSDSTPQPTLIRSLTGSIGDGANTDTGNTLKTGENTCKGSLQLDACPTEIIWKFINRSWRFIDAYYRKGLTGEAAAWAVHKQKSHRAVSESAMKALEARSKNKLVN
jgi:hypothetical protein